MNVTRTVRPTYLIHLGLAALLVASLTLTSCSWFRDEPEPTPTPTPTATPTPTPTPTPEATQRVISVPDVTPEVEQTPIEGTITPLPELSVIYFDYDKSNIRDDQLNAIQANAEWLLNNPEVSLLVEGHCDERGSNEYNYSLGDRRAGSVKEFFMNAGVDGSRIQTLSKGEEEPAVLGHDESAWRWNRRTEFYRVW